MIWTRSRFWLTDCLHREWPFLFPINAIIAFWPTPSIFSILWFCLQNWTVCAVYKNWVSPDQLLDHSFLSFHIPYMRDVASHHNMWRHAAQIWPVLSYHSQHTLQNKTRCNVVFWFVRSEVEPILNNTLWVEKEKHHCILSIRVVDFVKDDETAASTIGAYLYLYQHLHMPAQLNIHFGITCLKSTLSKPPCLGLCSRTDPLFLWITVLPWHPQFWASQSVCAAGWCCHWSMVHHIHHDSCTTVPSGEWCVRICDWIVCITLVPCKPIE